MIVGGHNYATEDAHLCDLRDHTPELDQPTRAFADRVTAITRRDMLHEVPRLMEGCR